MSKDPAKITGSCLCGKVTYIANLKKGVGVCHCSMCRKWSGGVYMSVHTDGDVEFNGAENIQSYESSEWAARGFCRHCGSSLYYHLKPRPEVPDGEYMIAAGSITDQSELKFDHEVYVDATPGWYRFEDEASRHRLTEAEILAVFAPDTE